MIKTNFGKKYHRVKGKDVAIGFSTDYTPSKEYDGYYLRDSEGQVLRDASEYPSVLIFKTEKAAVAFLKALKEEKTTWAST